MTHDIATLVARATEATEAASCPSARLLVGAFGIDANGMEGIVIAGSFRAFIAREDLGGLRDALRGAGFAVRVERR